MSASLDRPIRAVGMAALLAWTATTAGAGLYRCEAQPGTATYSVEPCAPGDAASVPIDRTTPTDRTLPRTGRAPPIAPAQKDSPVATPAARPAAEEHRLSAGERTRIAELRRERAPSAEARVAAEIEIAAIREGADARVTAEDRATLEALRPTLAAPDAGVRADALRTWEALYARYRPYARPRVPATPPALGAAPPRRASFPEPPLGAPVPGSQGPLVAPPASPAPTMTVRPGPIADPKTGQVLAPAGDRLVDPITGTIWMRSGPNYVDPATGRVIPGH